MQLPAWFVTAPTIPPVDVEAAALPAFETAAFALGCFWSPDSRFGGLEGVIRTRVGYAGGKQLRPSYRNIGDHTESFEVDYDPARTTYERLLEVFWASHDPTNGRVKTQYKPVIFVRNEAQKAKALRSREALAATGCAVRTEVLPLGTFTWAEDYHQKYYLRRLVKPYAELKALLGEGRGMTDSTAAMRANAMAGGHAEKAVLERDADRLGLSVEARAELAKAAGEGCG